MILDIVWLLLGLALIVFGADWLVDGSSAIARKLGIGEFVIGLTIVGFGTSCPELVVSLTGAIAGNGDISVGNVVGSNIFNIMLILGITALISPVAVTRQNARKDIPLVLLLTLLFTGLSVWGRGISRIEGMLFLVLFALYIWDSFKSDRPDGPSHDSEGSKKVMKTWLAVCLVLAGLAGLVFGGQLFVNGATSIARAVGVSDKVIAITLLAGGTSLPELATCIVAAAKHKDQLALGNVLGSNAFNILLIIGSSAVVSPIPTASMSLVDYAALVSGPLLLWLFTFTGRKNSIDRWEGALFVLGQVAYYAFLIIKG